MTRLQQPRLEALMQAAPGGVDGAMAGKLGQVYRFAHGLLGEAERFPGVRQMDYNVEVALSALQLGLEPEALSAALLRGTPSDKLIATQIGELFGRDVVLIREGLAKLEAYTSGASKTQRTLEAIRRALLTIIEGNLTIVLLRLVICLHDLEAAGTQSAEIQQATARDALDIYAPLANRLGVWQLKWPIEDLAFRYLNPDKYDEIADGLVHQRSERDQKIQAAIQRLGARLREEGIAAVVTGRPKHIYSIYRKMERKKLRLEEINDAQALRIIIEQDDPEDPTLKEEDRRKVRYNQTYRALGVVHSLWQPVPDEFDDYILQPKQNGYRSLHTAVLDDDGNVLEVQIRTRQMHRQAEMGIAAHWAYKEGGRLDPALQRQIQSLRQLLPALDQPVEVGDDSAEHLGEELLGERIFVFTPKKDVIDLPAGATPVDFAYAIHTEVGHRCRGARVNDKMVPLDHHLRSGDRVEIITYPRDSPGRPNRDWLNPNSGYTASNRTRSRIRRWFRQHEREQNVELGRKLLDEEIKHYRLGELVTYDELAHMLNESQVDDFLAKIGFGDISRSQVEGALKLLSRDRLRSEQADSIAPTPGPPTPGVSGKRILVLGASDLPTTLARCCNPIYPEPIAGYVTRGRGVTIHHQTCRQLQYKRRTEPGRVVAVEWVMAKATDEAAQSAGLVDGKKHKKRDKESSATVNNSKEGTPSAGPGEGKKKRKKREREKGVTTGGGYSVPFNVRAYRDANLIRRIADSLKGQNINLLKMKATNSGHYTDIYILAQVNDIDQAQWIMSKLQGFSNVVDVQSRHVTR